MAIDLGALADRIGAKVGRPGTDPLVTDAAQVTEELVAFDTEILPVDLPAGDFSLLAGMALVGAGIFSDPPASSGEITTPGDDRFDALYTPADLITAHSSYWQHLRKSLGAS